MNIKCPHCGAIDVRYSRIRTLSEGLGTLAGMRPLRCRNCRARFTGKLWHVSDIAYARCPRCYRMELSLWEERYYVGPAYKLFLVRLGAHPYRCEICRLNFVSVRARKERFRWHSPARSPLPRKE